MLRPKPPGYRTQYAFAVAVRCWSDTEIRNDRGFFGPARRAAEGKHRRSLGGRDVPRGYPGNRERTEAADRISADEAGTGESALAILGVLTLLQAFRWGTRAIFIDNRGSE